MRISDKLGFIQIISGRYRVNLRSKILHAVEPVSYSIGKIHAPFTVRLIKGLDFYNIQDTIKPGDILLSRSKYQLTNLFIPGFFKHAAVFVDMGSQKDLVEATSQGVHYTSLYDFVSTKDYIIILRLKNKEKYKSNLLKVCLIACKLVGDAYDYEFEFGDEEEYCSEVAVKSYSLAEIDIFQDKTIIYPTDLYDNQNFQVVFASGSCDGKHIRY
jgi:hypothetical protein